jgi:enoyl-CoA hydratase/carnithine racemase
MAYETIIYEQEGRKARIILNRPEKLNAISWQMQQELSRRRVLLAGNGDVA